MACPHGTCATCCWHTRQQYEDQNVDKWTLWKCWVNSGAPEIRLDTISDMEPPGCQSHLKASPRASA